MREGGFRVAAMAVLSLFFLEAVHRFVPAVYAKNIDALRLGPSALAVLLFLAPFAYIALPRLTPGRLLLPLAAGVVVFRLGLSLPLGLDGQLALGGLAIATFLLYLPAHLLWRLDDRSPGLDAAGFALAFALEATLRATNLGSDPLVDPGTIVVVVALAALAGFALLRVRGRERTIAEYPPPMDRRAVARALLLGLAFGALVGLELTLLAYPTVLARFAAASMPAMTIAVLGGLGFGIALLPRGAFPAAPWFLVGNLLLVLAVADLAWVGSPALPVLVALGQVAVVADFAFLFGYLRRAPSMRAAGIAFGTAGLVLVLYLFAFVFALAYAFVPGRGLWEGRLPVYLLLTALVAAIFSLILARRSHRHGLRIAPSGPVLARSFSVLVVLLLLAAGAGSVFAPTVATPPSPTTIRVMTYNVHQGFGQDGVLDLSRIRDVVRSADADIVALQESDTARITSGNQDAVRWLAVGLGYYEAYGPSTREQIFGVAILSRFPILSWRTVYLPSLEAQRVLVEARVQVGSAMLTVVAVHFGLPADERELQVAFLRSHLAPVPGPIVLMGDFNSCPSGRCPDAERPDGVYVELTGEWEDAWTAAGNSALDPNGNTWPAGVPDRRIDYVFVSSGIDVDEVFAILFGEAGVASDHKPVIADIRLS